MSVTDSPDPTRVVTAGVDWAKADHAVCLVDGDGEPIERVTIEHTRRGLARLIALLSRYPVSGVGIERPDGPVVDTLLAAGFTVYVIAPAQIKGLRQRYGSAGNKDDRFDAYVLADTVRTDRRRLTPLQPDADQTTALRQLCRARKDLVAQRVATANQLRAHLAGALPAAVNLFTDIDSLISRQFLTRFTTQDQVDWLSPKRIAMWLKTARYTGGVDPTVLYQRITAAPRGATGEYARTLAAITRAHVAVLTALVAQIQQLADQITTELDAHPDKDIYAALPRIGTVRAARLLAEIGDARGRFPTANSLAGLAGVVPSTRRSGTSTVVSYRWAVDKQLRDAVYDFAKDSRKADPWANNLYEKARARGHKRPHAVRILARAWIDIIWKCWTTNTPYNPDKHKALQHLLEQDQLVRG
jgi:transposase